MALARISLAMREFSSVGTKLVETNRNPLGFEELSDGIAVVRTWEIENTEAQ